MLQVFKSEMPAGSFTALSTVRAKKTAMLLIIWAYVFVNVHP
jgi:hypothetical protein